jgi:hypothetical protein
MRRILGGMFGAWAFFGLAFGAQAQIAPGYPPATGHMEFVYPTYPAPGAVGAPYAETFPSFTGTYGAPNAYVTQPRAYYPAQSAPAVVARGRSRNLFRGARTYVRGYNQAPVYSAQLPQGQLYWPGSYVTPNYTPATRFQSYGAGYGRGPYGSNFYGGMYQGYSMGY